MRAPRVISLFWITCIAEIILFVTEINERQSPLPPSLSFSLSLSNLSNSLQKNPLEKPTGKEKTISKIIFWLSTHPHPGNQFPVKSFQSKPWRRPVFKRKKQNGKNQPNNWNDDAEEDDSAFCGKHGGKIQKLHVELVGKVIFWRVSKP